jgi:1-acyl-sn-glycerol-3-phosphate acyltransferase
LTVPAASAPGAGPAAASPAVGPEVPPTAPHGIPPHQGGGRSRRLFRPIDVIDEPLAARLGSPFRPYLRLIIYGLMVLLLMPVQGLALALGARRLAEAVPQFFHRACWRILGIRVEQRGQVSSARPTLFVSNHSSYLDVTVLGALIPGCFVAKSEVAGWPLFGLLAKLQRTVFVDRRRNSAHEQRDGIASRLAAGDNLILFPEGTSNDGNRTLPFRSALLSVAEPGRAVPGGATLTVQPVSIAYTRLNGMPLGHGLRPLVAWYGDMVLADHLWQFLRLGNLTVEVQFHDPVTIDRFGSRKALTDHCYSKVAEGVAASLTGRRDAAGEEGASTPAPAAAGGEDATAPGGGESGSDGDGR